MDIVNQPIFQFSVELIIFIVLTAVGVFILDKIRNSDNRYLNPQEFLPKDEIHTLKQVFYLILMSLCFVTVLYTLISTKSDIPYLSFFDTLVGLVDFIHVPVFLYFVKHYYDKFNHYTESNGLSLAILLLFVIILFSFFLTQVAEGKNPLDALVMVSNAFTSNGYAVLGNSIPGKINSLFLVWGGYVISGVATASLTAAILIKHFNKRVEKLERIIEEGSDE